MPMTMAPKTMLGKWSVALNAVFLIALAVSLTLVKILGWLSFNDRWWDVTALVFPASVIGGIIGAVAVFKNKERGLSVHLSVFAGACTFLFLIFHSLFIND